MPSSKSLPPPELVAATKPATALRSGDVINVRGVGRFAVAESPVPLGQRQVIPLAFERLALVVATSAVFDTVSLAVRPIWSHRICRYCGGSGTGR